MKKIFFTTLCFVFLLIGCASQSRVVELERQISKLQKADIAEKSKQLEEDIRDATRSAGKWSSYGSLGSGNIADTDDFMVRDINDTSLGPTGTQKLYTFANLKTDLSAFDNFGFPYSTNPTVDEAAEAAVDTTDDQLLYYGGALRTLSYKRRECFTLEDPADADDDIPIFSLDDGFTVTRLDCIIDTGTSVVMVLNDGTNNMDSMTCTTSETSDTSLSNNTFSALEGMELDVGTVTGTVNWVRMCFTYTITRE